MNEYLIIVNDKSYELPNKTIAVTERLDEALKVYSIPNLKIRQKFEKLHTFVKSVVGEENAAEMFGSSKLDEIDLSELSLVVLKINDAYDKPLADYKNDEMRAKMDSIPLDKIASMVNAAQTASKLQPLAR